MHQYGMGIPLIDQIIIYIEMLRIFLKAPYEGLYKYGSVKK